MLILDSMFLLDLEGITLQFFYIPESVATNLHKIVI